MHRVEAVSPARTATKKTEAGQAADDKPTLMLLDGNSLAFRAFYALPAENFKTQGGLTTNAVYGFTAMLINLLRDESPTHVAAAFDVSRQTFRSERYPEYKANRSSTPDEFRGQIDVTKEVLAALGITVLAEPGFGEHRNTQSRKDFLGDVDLSAELVRRGRPVCLVFRVPL